MYMHDSRQLSHELKLSSCLCSVASLVRCVSMRTCDAKKVCIPKSLAYKHKHKKHRLSLSYSRYINTNRFSSDLYCSRSTKHSIQNKSIRANKTTKESVTRETLCTCKRARATVLYVRSCEPHQIYVRQCDASTQTHTSVRFQPLHSEYCLEAKAFTKFIPFVEYYFTV